MLSITHIDGLDSHVKSIDDKLRPTLRTTIDVSPHNDESFDTVDKHWPKGDTIAYNACVVRMYFRDFTIIDALWKMGKISLYSPMYTFCTVCLYGTCISFYGSFYK